ncbi:MAG: SDR family NAD(P)-dependent oxidoreductase [Myxococcales bacterium]|jgi:NAD(P)-dependent dehydrogenase (short-subunit alcohol dehydrogenase family)|nr:SDR family NAD(P)-dependent oxidoreductase [Myxococcales bacterium]
MSEIVVVTGGAGALGAAVAKKLSARGDAVAIFDTPRGEARAREIAAALGPRVHVEVGDFATREAWQAALPRVAAALGGAPTMAALVAGGWAGGKPLHEAEDDVWDRMSVQNVDTARRALAALLPPMVAAGHGAIAVVGSRAVERPWTSAGAAAYAASKAAVVAMVQVAAQENVARGVRLNAILPSTMDTPANRAAMPDVDPATWVTTESAASVIAWLLSPDARDVSGAAIPVYGRA